jgi:archaellum biogenesis ATPase FlaH
MFVRRQPQVLQYNSLASVTCEVQTEKVTSQKKKRIQSRKKMGPLTSEQCDVVIEVNSQFELVLTITSCSR